MGYHVGCRDEISFELFFQKIEHYDVVKYTSDYWKPYNLLPNNKHLKGKAHTYTVERTNRRLRHYLARLGRKTYCVSKSKKMLEASLTLFIYQKYIIYMQF